MENPQFDWIYQERWGFSWAILVSGRVFYAFLLAERIIPIEL